MARTRLRLIMQRQFAIADRGRQVLMQRTAVAQLLIEFHIKEIDRATRCRLGAEQRSVRIGQQRLGITAVARIDRNADGEADANRTPFEHEFGLHGLHQPCGERFCRIRLQAIDD